MLGAYYLLECDDSDRVAFVGWDLMSPNFHEMVLARKNKIEELRIIASGYITKSRYELVRADGSTSYTSKASIKLGMMANINRKIDTLVKIPAGLQFKKTNLVHHKAAVGDCEAAAQRIYSLAEDKMRALSMERRHELKIRLQEHR